MSDAAIKAALVAATDALVAGLHAGVGKPTIPAERLAAAAVAAFLRALPVDVRVQPHTLLAAAVERAAREAGDE